MKKTAPTTILVVDDDEDIRFTAEMVLGGLFTVKTLESPAGLADFLMQNPVNALLLDLNFKPGQIDGAEGFACLRMVKEKYPHIPVVLITAYGDIPLAVKGMKEGAADFVTKPWDDQALLETVRAVVQPGNPEKAPDPDMADTAFLPIVSQSAEMEAVRQVVMKVAPTEAEVLILGENGTGKELVARAIHELSPRAAMPFVKVDLGAIPENLFESELFGHKKGAFTDAREDRPGRLEMASGGTLFLDEIGNLAPGLQTKLLSVLQNRQVFRVGENTPRQINIRLVCATNMPLYEMATGTRAGMPIFRQDLLYRINTVEIHLPPLSNRQGDIPVLVQHFMRVYGEKYHKEALRISAKALAKLQGHSWPGNIRELQHAVERAVIMADADTLHAADFPLKTTPASTSKEENYNLEEMEKKAILKAIDKHHGNMTRVARELGMGRTTLYRRMEKYGI